MTVWDGGVAHLVNTAWFSGTELKRDAFDEAELEPAPPKTVILDDKSILQDDLQDDLRDMCRALGLPDAPQPRSPHEVFRECIAKMHELRERLKKTNVNLRQMPGGDDPDGVIGAIIRKNESAIGPLREPA